MSTSHVTNWNVSAVEQDIPVPPMQAKRKKGGRPGRYHFEELTPLVDGKGPSFLISCPKVEITRLWSSISSCARSYEKRTKTQFTMRRVAGGIRVWRLK